MVREGHMKWEEIMRKSDEDIKKNAMRSWKLNMTVTTDSNCENW